MRRAGRGRRRRREILDNVWDFAFEGDPNIVEVYIRHLRRKLDEPFGRQLIETIRGAGLPARPRRRLTRCAGSRPSGCASPWRAVAGRRRRARRRRRAGWSARSAHSLTHERRRPPPGCARATSPRRSTTATSAARSPCHAATRTSCRSSTATAASSPRRRTSPATPRISRLEPDADGYAARTRAPASTEGDGPFRVVAPRVEHDATGTYTVYVARQPRAGRPTAPTASMRLLLVGAPALLAARGRRLTWVVTGPGAAPGRGDPARGRGHRRRGPAPARARARDRTTRSVAWRGR